MTPNSKTMSLVKFSILLAILAVFCFTPLGSIPVGPVVATLGMIPVIVTAILLGTGAGAAMGFCAGLFSFIVWTFIPPNPALAFVFTPLYSFGEFSGHFGSVLICFLPRILVGVVAGACAKGLSRVFPDRSVRNYAIAGALASLTNTVLVLGGIWLFFGEQYSAVIGEAILYLIGVTVLTNGIPEAVVSAIAAPAVCRPLLASQRRR